MLLSNGSYANVGVTKAFLLLGLSYLVILEFFTLSERDLIK